MEVRMEKTNVEFLVGEMCQKLQYNLDKIHNLKNSTVLQGVT